MFFPDLFFPLVATVKWSVFEHVSQESPPPHPPTSLRSFLYLPLRPSRRLFPRRTDLLPTFLNPFFFQLSSSFLGSSYSFSPMVAIISLRETQCRWPFLFFDWLPRRLPFGPSLPFSPFVGLCILSRLFHRMLNLQVNSPCNSLTSSEIG